MDHALTPHRIARFRIVIGLSLVWLGCAALFSSRPQWSRAFDPPLTLGATDLEKSGDKPPKHLLVQVKNENIQRTDLFRNDSTRYWALPVGNSFLLVRRDSLARPDAELVGALERLDDADQSIVDKLDWLKLYARAKLDTAGKARVVPYVLVVPYRPGRDLAMLVVLSLVVLIGFGIAVAGLLFYRSRGKAFAALAPPEVKGKVA